MSNDDDNQTAVSEEHKEDLIDADLPLDPEEVEGDVEDFPTE